MNFYSPDTYLYSECDLPKDIFIKLKEVVNYEENNSLSYNKKLAGNIKNEYQLINLDEDFILFLEKHATDFYTKNNSKSLSKKIELKLKSIWMNKQKKYEFNPLHAHDGQVSFVCWVQIPYNLQDELNLENCINSNTQSNSLFSFVFTDYNGIICTKSIMVDKSYEGKCIFFDSRTNHQVHPFYTSDDCRISISGNFHIVSNNIKKLSYN